MISIRYKKKNFFINQIEPRTDLSYKKYYDIQVLDKNVFIEFFIKESISKGHFFNNYNFCGNDINFKIKEGYVICIEETLFKINYTLNKNLIKII